MREINKLVHLVTHGLKSNFGVIDLSGKVKNPGKEQRLYNGTLQGNFENDEITAKGMYNTNIYDQRFRMLKSRLRYKLYDLLYYLDFELPKYSYVVQKRLECKEYLHKTAILFELGEYAMAEKQYNKVIVVGEECQFIPELIEANEWKRKVLAKEFKPTDFELTIQELERLRKLSHQEEEAEDLFLKMELLLSKSVHSRNVSGPSVVETIEKLEAMFAKTKSNFILDCIYKLNIWKFSINDDFEGLIEFLKKAPEKVLNLSVNEQMFDYGHNYYLLAKSYLSTEQFGEGLEAVKKGYTYIDKSVDSWFALSETHFLLAMHSMDYQEAHTVLTQVFKNPNFNRSSQNIINRWKILKIYLNFAAPAFGIQKRIRFYDIYESSDSYFTELKGYKMSLYLLEFIHNLNKDNFDMAATKLDDLESFFYKNLNDPGKHAREKQFFKMLKVLKTTGFDIEETKSKIELYHQRLREKKAQSAFSDFEIIPYENLWQIVLEAAATNGKEKMLS